MKCLYCSNESFTTTLRIYSSLTGPKVEHDELECDECGKRHSFDYYNGADDYEKCRQSILDSVTEWRNS